MAYVYAPIALLIIGVFLLVEYRAHELRKLGAHAAPVTTVSDK